MSGYAPPLGFRYDGDGAWSPYSPYVARRANEHYAVGEVLLLVPHQERSQASHNHFFARLAELWQTLPESLAEEYPSSEHLRKKALIRCGYADERSIVCASKAEALRVAAFIRPMDDYAIVVASGATVKVFTAKSQSIRAMGKADFEQSKADVLQFCERLVAGAKEVAA